MLGTDLRNNPTSCRYFISRSSDIIGHWLFPVSTMLRYHEKESKKQKKQFVAKSGRLNTERQNKAKSVKSIMEIF